MSLRSRRNKTSGHPLKATAVDLFCGAGGLTRGLLDAGIPVVAGYDTDNACRHAYEHNNRGVKFITKSVSDLNSKTLAGHYPKDHVRILVGCAPCQPFSRYTQGLAIKTDTKWSLLHEFARLIRELNPDIVSMENVPELQQHSIFADFLATDYGIPQHRRRLVLVASGYRLHR